MSVPERSVLRPLFCAIGLSLTACVSTFAADVKSGLQPGDIPSAFQVDDITGPRSGNTLCYACAFGKHRVVNIQTKSFSDELIQLIKRLDSLVDPAGEIRGDSRHAFVVYLTDDPDTAAEELESIAAKHQIKNIPLTIYDELTGPRPYRLSPEAQVTVMMWADMEVAKNHAFDDASLATGTLEQIVRDAQEHLAN